MKRLIIAAVGLALGVALAGFLLIARATVHQEAALAQVPTVTATPFHTPTPTPVPVGSGCYTNWNSADCAPGWTAVSVGEWTQIVMSSGAAFICAAPKEATSADNHPFASSTDSLNRHFVLHEPCAICCGADAAGSPSVVGGIAEHPAVVAMGTSGTGSSTYAVLVGAAAGVLAFAVLGILTAKRRGGQQ